VLHLENNTLEGSIPDAVCHLTRIQSIHLSLNSLVGTLPACLYMLQLQLKALHLYGNSFHGSIPETYGRLSNLKLLDLGGNNLMGTLPRTLGALHKLQFLALNSNKFHGSIPGTMVNLHKIKIIMMQNNSLHGRIPALNFSKLMWVILNNNLLTGPVPWASLYQQNLQVLSLAGNALQGPVAPEIPIRVVQLLLDNNRFTGQLPSFQHLNQVRSLSVHNNKFKGQLHLPDNSSSALEAVFAHNNLGLSCPITYADYYPHEGQLRMKNLLLAGNRFSSPIPSWAAMHDATAMYQPSWLVMWTDTILYASLGLPLLPICLYLLYREHMHEFFVFTPAQGLERLELWCAKVLAWTGIPAMVVLLPLYIAGAQLYDCGDWRLLTTIAYLSDSVAIEWCIAVLACGAAGAGSFLLMALHEQAEAQFPNPQKSPPLSWTRYSVILAIWFVIVLACSLPTALYALSKTMPNENTMGLSEAALNICQWVTVVILFFILTVIIPSASHRLVRSLTGQTDLFLSCRLQSMARLGISTVVPTVVVLIFDNSCFSYWLHFWSPCVENPGSFNISISMQPDVSRWTAEVIRIPGSQTNAYIQYTESDLLGYFLGFNLPYQVTTHSGICDPSWVRGERCSRGVMMVVGDLVFKKLIFFAMFAPALTMFCSLPPVMRRLRQVWGWMMPGVDFLWYRGDSELAFIMLFVEQVLCFGFVAPLLLPLAAIGLALNTAVYHCGVHKLGLPVKYGVNPSLKVLYLARAEGLAFVIWFFLDNDLHGKLLVVIGVPLCACAAEYLLMYLKRSRTAQNITSRGLLEPLLGPEEGVVWHSTRGAETTEIDLDIVDEATDDAVAEATEDAPLMLEVQGCALTDGPDLDGRGWQRMPDVNGRPAWRRDEPARGFIYFLPFVDFWDWGSEDDRSPQIACWAMSCCGKGANPPTYVAAPSGDAELPTQVGGWMAPRHLEKKGMVVVASADDNN